MSKKIFCVLIAVVLMGSLAACSLPDFLGGNKPAPTPEPMPTPTYAPSVPTMAPTPVPTPAALLTAVVVLIPQ